MTIRRLLTHLPDRYRCRDRGLAADVLKLRRTAFDDRTPGLALATSADPLVRRPPALGADPPVGILLGHAASSRPFLGPSPVWTKGETFFRGVRQAVRSHAHHVDQMRTRPRPGTSKVTLLIPG